MATSTSLSPHILCSERIAGSVTDIAALKNVINTRIHPACFAFIACSTSGVRAFWHASDGIWVKTVFLAVTLKLKEMLKSPSHHSGFTSYQTLLTEPIAQRLLIQHDTSDPSTRF